MSPFDNLTKACAIIIGFTGEKKSRIMQKKSATVCTQEVYSFFLFTDSLNSTRYEATVYVHEKLWGVPSIEIVNDLYIQDNAHMSQRIRSNAKRIALCIGSLTETTNAI